MASLPPSTSMRTLVGMCADVARAEGCAFAIVEVDHCVDQEALERAFPAIDHAAVELHDGPFAFRYADDASAQDAFTTLSRGIAAAHRRSVGAVDATVRFVGRVGNSPVMATANSSSTRSMHVFVGGALVHEDAYQGKTS